MRGYFGFQTLAERLFRTVGATRGYIGWEVIDGPKGISVHPEFQGSGTFF